MRINDNKVGSRVTQQLLLEVEEYFLPIMISYVFDNDNIVLVYIMVLIKYTTKQL